MMSTQERHLVYGTGGYSPYVPQQSELSPQSAANNGYVYYAPQMEHILNAPLGKYEDEAVEGHEDKAAQSYNTDAFSGYCTALSSIDGLPDQDYSAPTLNCQSAGPVGSLPHGPSLHDFRNACVEQGQQQHTSSYSRFHPYLHSKHDIGYSSNGSDSGSRGSFNLRNAHQGYCQPSEGLTYSMPTYEVMNTQSH